MTQHTRNILKVYKQATPSEVDAGVSWYANANAQCTALANEYSLPLHIVVGVVSALSPNNKWERNIKDGRSVIAAHTAGDSVDNVTVCTYSKMRAKAWRIMDEATDMDSVLAILNGQKIKAFAECIMGQDTCVIDGHAYNIAMGERYSLTSPSVNVGVRAFRDLQQAYIRAGKRRDHTAYEMQAITWVTWRRIHNIK